MSRSFKQRALISSMILTTSIVGLVILAGSRISVADIMYLDFRTFHSKSDSNLPFTLRSVLLLDFCVTKSAFTKIRPSRNMV